MFLVEVPKVTVHVLVVVAATLMLFKLYPVVNCVILTLARK